MAWRDRLSSFMRRDPTEADGNQTNASGNDEEEADEALGQTQIAAFQGADGSGDRHTTWSARGEEVVSSGGVDDAQAAVGGQLQDTLAPDVGAFEDTTLSLGLGVADTGNDAGEQAASDSTTFLDSGLAGSEVEQVEPEALVVESPQPGVEIPSEFPEAEEPEDLDV